MISKRKPSAHLLAGLALLLAVGCSRCGSRGPGAADPARYVPVGVDAVVLVPHLSRAVGDATALARLKPAGLVSQLAGLGDPNGLLANLKVQLGFDPTTPDGLASVGLDGNAALLVSRASDGSPLAVLSVADGARFSAEMEKIARDRLGAPNRSEKDGVVTFASAPPAAPALACPDFGRAGRSSARGRAASKRWPVPPRGPWPRASHPTRARALAQRAKDQAVAVCVPRASPMAGRAGLGAGLAEATAGMGLHDAHIAIDLPLTTVGTTAVASMKGGVGSNLLSRLDPDAVLVVRTGLDPATLWPAADAVVPLWIQKELLAMGLQVKRILANLKPGAAMSLSLTGAADLARISLDPRDSNPFSLLTLWRRGA